ncbi:MAG: META domain-containing protein [Sphingomonadaceae bacterium]|uniref:META domain-containing protein n=1 Tax=Thermaurantiacus sp. TaxID=2820283 RepID=UPI00298EF620|nr:META domain-containing protein [Thermaurantiacus sp.]MCS6987187.1 META domain-containing protein [Sphingomonadaceae bacterium]MDW8415779.1 META domain-containing protein [Thermaurantiacus sp.]
MRAGAFAALLLAACGMTDRPTPPAAPAPAVGGTPAVLAGTSWRVIEVEGRPAAGPTMGFRDGRIFGSTGCNRYTGGTTAEAEMDGQSGRLATPPLATTRMACPEPAMAVERAFLEALERADRWRLTAEGELELAAGGQVVIRAQPAPAA